MKSDVSTRCVEISLIMVQEYNCFKFVKYSFDYIHFWINNIHQLYYTAVKLLYK